MPFLCNGEVCGFSSSVYESLNSALMSRCDISTKPHLFSSVKLSSFIGQLSANWFQSIGYLPILYCRARVFAVEYLIFRVQDTQAKNLCTFLMGSPSQKTSLSRLIFTASGVLMYRPPFLEFSTEYYEFFMAVCSQNYRILFIELRPTKRRKLHDQRILKKYYHCTNKLCFIIPITGQTHLTLHYISHFFDILFHYNRIRPIKNSIPNLQPNLAPSRTPTLLIQVIKGMMRFGLLLMLNDCRYKAGYIQVVIGKGSKQESGYFQLFVKNEGWRFLGNSLVFC